MNDIHYKTWPRLFLVVMYLSGFFFFGLLSYLIFKNIQTNSNYLVWLILFFFACISALSLFYFLKIKIIKLSKDKLIVSHILFPIKHIYIYSDVNGITQETKVIKALNGVSFKTRYIFTDYTTIIHLTDKKIKLNSVGSLDFESLTKCFRKLKAGEGKCNPQKSRLINYLLDNFDGLLFAAVCLFLTIGLACNLFKH